MDKKSRLQPSFLTEVVVPFKGRKMNQYDHIPRPVKPGKVIRRQTGWAFTIVGACGNEYHINTATHKYPATAKDVMRDLVVKLNKQPAENPA